MSPFRDGGVASAVGPTCTFSTGSKSSDDITSGSVLVVIIKKRQEAGRQMTLGRNGHLKGEG